MDASSEHLLLPLEHLLLPLEHLLLPLEPQLLPLEPQLQQLPDPLVPQLLLLVDSGARLEVLIAIPLEILAHHLAVCLEAPLVAPLGALLQHLEVDSPLELHLLQNPSLIR